MAEHKRLVYAEEIKEIFDYEVSQGATDLFDAFDSAIENATTVDAVEVVHSRWDTVFYERNGTLASYSHLCLKCKYFYRDVKSKGHNYCPNCGAKMDGDADGC